MSRCYRCDTLRPPHAICKEDCEAMKEEIQENSEEEDEEAEWDYFETDKIDYLKEDIKCEEYCWDWHSRCFNLVKYGTHYCSQHQLKNNEKECPKEDCCYKALDKDKCCSYCQSVADSNARKQKITKEIYGGCTKCYDADYYRDKRWYHLIQCFHGKKCLTTSCDNLVYKRDTYYCDDHTRKCCYCQTVVYGNERFCYAHKLEVEERERKKKLKADIAKQKQENLKSLVRQRTSLSNPQEVVRFEPWWSNNLATVVNYNSGYWVYLLVYVKENDTVKVFPESSSCSYWGDSGKSRKNHDSLSDASSEASWLRNQLTSYGKYYDHPILLIHPNCDCYRSFNDFVTSPYVWKEEIGNSFTFYIPFVITVGVSQIPSNLDDYFKPLDIIRVKKVNSIVSKTYFHVGIYLGKNAICHICDPNGLISEENLQVRITGWDAFLNGWLGTPINGKAGELQRYRPIVPFKYYKKSIEQAVKAWYADYGSGKYDLYNDNCEHFANAIIFGAYYSQQIADSNVVGNFLAKTWDEIWTKNHNFFWKIFQPNHWGTIWRDTPLLRLFDSKKYKANNGKGKEINLRDEINSWDSGRRFENLISCEPSRIEEYERQYLIQVSPEQDCGIM